MVKGLLSHLAQVLFVDIYSEDAFGLGDEVANNLMFMTNLFHARDVRTDWHRISLFCFINDRYFVVVGLQEEQRFLIASPTSWYIIPLDKVELLLT